MTDELTDAQKAQRLLDRASRRMTSDQQSVCKTIADGYPPTQCERRMFDRLCTEFAADLKP